MRRRTFLAAASALGALEVDPAALADRAPAGGTVDLAALVARLPTADALAADGVEVSATRLLDGATTLDGSLGDAAAVGTVLAGRVATDVAVGVTDPGAVADRLRDDGYERRARRDGWLMFGRTGRRHRVAAVGDGEAVVGAGPRAGPVRRHVGTVTAALDRPSGAADGDAGVRTRVLDHLAPGVQVAVDLDPARSAPGLLATGRSLTVSGDTTLGRRVAVFDAASRARATDETILRGLPGASTPTDGGVRYDGRALVRESTAPTRELFAEV